MTSNLIPRWAVLTDIDFLRVTGHTHLPKIVLRRKIDWQEIAVVTMNGKLIGYIFLDYIWSSVPFIATIWVLEAYRGQGVGKALLQFIENEVSSHGQKILYSSSQADETAPQEWHRKMGFEECGILAGHNDGIGEIFFRKVLKHVI